MCDQETIRKIDAGKLKVVNPWEHYLKLWSPLFFFLSSIVYITVWVTKIEANGFDSPKQKENIISWYEDYKII